MTTKEILEYIKRAQVESGESVRKIASEAGYSGQAIYAWFEGKAQPRLDSLLNIASVLGLEVSVRHIGDVQWVDCVDRQQQPGKYQVKGKRRDGMSFRGWAIFYPDQKWYSLNGKLIWQIDQWLDDGEARTFRMPAKTWHREEAE